MAAVAGRHLVTVAGADGVRPGTAHLDGADGEVVVEDGEVEVAL